MTVDIAEFELEVAHKLFDWQHREVPVEWRLLGTAKDCSLADTGKFRTWAGTGLSWGVGLQELQGAAVGSSPHTGPGWL